MDNYFESLENQQSENDTFSEFLKQQISLTNQQSAQFSISEDTQSKSYEPINYTSHNLFQFENKCPQTPDIEMNSYKINRKVIMKEKRRHAKQRIMKRKLAQKSIEMNRNAKTNIKAAKIQKNPKKKQTKKQKQKDLDPEVNSYHQNLTPAQLKRVLKKQKNREAAQKTRDNKKAYLENLEKDYELFKEKDVKSQEKIQRLEERNQQLVAEIQRLKQNQQPIKNIYQPINIYQDFRSKTQELMTDFSNKNFPKQKKENNNNQYLYTKKSSNKSFFTFFAMLAIICMFSSGKINATQTHRLLQATETPNFAQNQVSFVSKLNKSKGLNELKRKLKLNETLEEIPEEIFQANLKVDDEIDPISFNVEDIQYLFNEMKPILQINEAQIKLIRDHLNDFEQNSLVVASNNEINTETDICEEENRSFLPSEYPPQESDSQPQTQNQSLFCPQAFSYSKKNEKEPTSNFVNNSFVQFLFPKKSIVNYALDGDQIVNFKINEDEDDVLLEVICQVKEVRQHKINVQE